jgi:TonB family protein
MRGGRARIIDARQPNPASAVAFKGKMEEGCMMTKTLAALLILCVCVFSRAATAQDDNSTQTQPECPAPVYKPAEVKVKPLILAKPEPSYPEQARRSKVSGKVVVEAVLCSTGKVADVVVIKGLPEGLSERAVSAARLIRFKPGRKDG